MKRAIAFYGFVVVVSCAYTHDGSKRPERLIHVAQPLMNSGQPGADYDFFCKNIDSHAKRVNGVLLSATRVKVDGGNDKIVLEWSMDYDGPRPPLTILAPMLDGATFQQTEVYCYAAGKDKKAYQVCFSSPVTLGPYFAKKEWFLTVKDRKALTGAVAIPLGKMAGEFQKKWPEQFGKAAPPLRIRMVHSPIDRGERFGLDAWTVDAGRSLRLSTKTIEVVLKNW